MNIKIIFIYQNNIIQSIFNICTFYNLHILLTFTRLLHLGWLRQSCCSQQTSWNVEILYHDTFVMSPTNRIISI